MDCILVGGLDVMQIFHAHNADLTEQRRGLCSGPAIGYSATKGESVMKSNPIPSRFDYGNRAPPGLPGSGSVSAKRHVG